MAEVKKFEDLNSDEVQNSLDVKIKELVNQINELKDWDAGNDSLDWVMDKTSEMTTSNVLNKELKNALISADSSVIKVLINELKKFKDKEWVFDLINSLTDVQYEKSVKDMNDSYDQAVNSMDSKFYSKPTEIEQPTEEPFGSDVSDKNDVDKNLYDDFNAVIDWGDYSKLDNFSKKQIDDLVNYLSKPNNEEKFYNLYWKISDKTSDLYTSWNVYIMSKFEKIALDKNEEKKVLLWEFEAALDGDDYGKIGNFSKKQIDDLVNYLSQPYNEEKFYNLYWKVSDKTSELYTSWNVDIMEKFEKIALDKKMKNSES